MAKRLRGCRKLGFAVLLLALVVLGLPSCLVRGCDWGSPPVEKIDGPAVKLQVAAGNVISLPLEQYLVGVVAAEMPASFHKEALKAQAVAARTYTLRRVQGKTADSEHPDAHLCSDPAHCQAWITTSEMRARWGLLHFRGYYEKVAAAVKETEGQVLVCDGELIDPVYHSSCGGRGTEDARDVWGQDVPYLKRVTCTFDPPEKQEPVISRFSMIELLDRLGVAEKTVPAAAGAGSLIQIKEHTASGRVKKVQVGSSSYRGAELRQNLGLRSTDFTVKNTGNEVVFLTRGYGHAVGMCQYGAEGLAQRGVRYDKILAHYYRGASLKTMP